MQIKIKDEQIDRWISRQQLRDFGIVFELQQYHRSSFPNFSNVNEDF